MNISNNIVAFAVIPIIAISVIAGVYLTGLNNENGSVQIVVTTTCMISCSSSTNGNFSPISSTFTTSNTSATFCVSSGETIPHDCNVTERSENSTVTSTSSSTANYQNGILSINRAFSYNQIPSNFKLGNFTIRLVNNGTGYETPPVNGTSRVITGFVFAFNVTTPDRSTRNTYFTWWPPCDTNLGVPCEQNNASVLPTPTNATINYFAANLVILWYTNSTGLYVSFQQWEEIQTMSPVTTSHVTTLSNSNLTIIPITMSVTTVAEQPYTTATNSS